MSKAKTERGSGTTFLREKGATMMKVKTPPAPARPKPAPRPEPTTTEAEAPPADRTRLAWANGAFAIVTITKGGKPQDYLAEMLSQNVHRLTKLEAGRSTTYLVKIGKEKTCGCDGHRHGHDCKHIRALLALKSAKEEGRI